MNNSIDEPCELHLSIFVTSHYALCSFFYDSRIRPYDRVYIVIVEMCPLVEICQPYICISSERS